MNFMRTSGILLAACLLFCQACNESSINPLNDNNGNTEPSKALSEVLGVEWQLSHFEYSDEGNVAAPGNQLFTMTFTADRVAGMANCNDFVSEYTAGTGESLSVTVVSLGVQDCNLGAASKANAFHQGLHNARQYYTDGKVFRVDITGNADGLVALHFVKREITTTVPEELNKTWRLTNAMVTNDGGISWTNVAEPKSAYRYTISFTDKGAYGWIACNSFTTDFEAGNGGQLTFSNWDQTNEACNPLDYDMAYVYQIDQAATYEIVNDELRISTPFFGTTQYRYTFSKRRDEIQSNVGIIMRDDLNPASQELQTDPFEILSASVNQNKLQIAVSYSGGCEIHDFILLGDETSMSDNPAGVMAWLRHDDKNDPCDAVISDILEYDLEPLKQKFIDKFGSVPGGEVILMIQGSDQVFNLLFEFD